MKSQNRLTSIAGGADPLQLVHAHVELATSHANDPDDMAAAGSFIAAAAAAGHDADGIQAVTSRHVAGWSGDPSRRYAVLLRMKRSIAEAIVSDRGLGIAHQPRISPDIA